MEDEISNTKREEIITEKEIFDSPIFFKAFSEMAASGVIIYDKSKLLYVNPYFIELLEYSKDELLNVPFSKLIHAEFRELVTRRAIERLNGKEVPRHYEFKAITKSGNELWFDFSASTFEYKGEKFGLASIFDITERKRTEEEIKRAKEEWVNTFDSIEDMIFVIDTEYRILKVNKAFCQMYKLKDEEVIGKRCYEIINEKSELCPNCIAIKSFEDKKTHFEEWDDPRINKYLHVSISPLFDDKNNILGFIHVARDISKMIYAERELINSLKLKSDFISKVSHELRTPITALKEGLELLLKDSSVTLSIDQRNILDIIQRNINRLTKNVTNILDFQQLAAGKFKFNISENDISEVLSETYELMRPIVREKGLEFTLNLDKSLPPMMFDRDRIFQVITSLLDNAIKFTDEGSINIVSKNCGKYIKIAIQDTGRGIKREELSYIFEIFAQFEEAQILKGSIGLGLPICKKIIEHHGGRIWAESEYGKGSSFYFELPI